MYIGRAGPITWNQDRVSEMETVLKSATTIWVYSKHCQTSKTECLQK